VPGPKIAYAYAMTAFGVDDDVPVSFHAAMLDAAKRRRLVVFPHDQADLYEGVSECGIVAQAIVSEPMAAFSEIRLINHRQNTCPGKEC
jgi:hypothetical protein